MDASNVPTSAIDSAVRTNNLLFFVYVLVGVIALALSVLLWKAANRVQDAIKADADVRIELARRDSALANERATALELQVVTQRERAADAERRLLELQDKLAQRRLTDIQKQQIRDFLRGKPTGPTSVECPTGSHEACAYAEEIAATLKSGGIPATFAIAALVRVKPGILLLQRNEGAALPHVDAIGQAFLAAGLEFEARHNPGVPDGYAVIRVGPK